MNDAVVAVGSASQCTRHHPARDSAAFGLPVSLIGLAALGNAWAQVPPSAAPVQTVSITGYADPVQKTELSNDPAANPASVTVLKLTEEKARGVRD